MFLSVQVICIYLSQSALQISKQQKTKVLNLKAPVTTAADDIHKYFFIVFSEKIRLDVSARQRIHMKNQAIFSSKDKSKKIKMSSAAFFCLAL